MSERYDKPDPTFTIYARFGVNGTEWFEKEVSVEVLNELAANPLISRNKDGLLCCPADLAGKMQGITFDDGTLVGGPSARAD